MNKLIFNKLMWYVEHKWDKSCIVNANNIDQ